MALTETDVTHAVWRCAQADGTPVIDTLRFCQDGRIAGFNNVNVRRWQLDAGNLCFYAEDGSLTARFQLDATPDPGAAPVLQGRSVLAPDVVLQLHQRDWQATAPSVQYTRALFAREIEAYGWQIGEHTYGSMTVFERNMARLTIGRYCSISVGVVVALGNHRLDTVSSYPFATLRGDWLSVPPGRADHDTNGDIVIGNDVWIGAQCFIGSGITIGDGAVLGAHSVITADVPPYAVVAGNPARIVRQRFSPQVVDRLLRLCWWDWPDEKVDRYLPLMLGGNMNAFLRAARAPDRPADEAEAG